MNNKLILVKYASEIFLKGLNRGKFERRLKENIEKKLSGLQFEFVTDQGRGFIKAEDIDAAVERVRKVFGVSEVCIVTEVERDLTAIKEEALRKVKEANPKTFKIETNRANKKFQLNSIETSRNVGGYVLHHFGDGLEVDVKNPECLVNIEIREKAYVFTSKDKIKGVGGLPYGMNGSTMLMLSGGIDSPVAGYLMARRGVELNCVYYHSHPYTSERAKDKVKELAKILSNYTERVNLYIVPFTDIQLDIMEKCRQDELTILMRRFMMRCACVLAEKYGVQSISSGESIGQVASQTMEALYCTNEVAKMPVFRPLIGMDKNEVVDIAKSIDTYETSILPYEDCCTIFNPKRPKTRPNLREVIEWEGHVDFSSLEDIAFKESEIIYL